MTPFGYTVLGFGSSSGVSATELVLSGNANNQNIKTLALAAGANFEQAARLANYAAGLVVMKRGTSTVDVDELRRALSLDN